MNGMCYVFKQRKLVASVEIKDVVSVFLNVFRNEVNAEAKFT
jgi:hypothetical protein